MPYHLEKGVLGLRLDYLTRSPAVQQQVLERMQAREDPFVVVTDININGVGRINVFADSRSEFKEKLDLLLAVDPTPPDPYNRRSGNQYQADHQALKAANNDNPGNRDAFIKYWMDPNNRAAVSEPLKDVLIAALTSGRHHIDYWWECSLEDGEPPQVMVFETPGAAHVLFITDHGPVQPMTTGVRGTPEADV
jgi:hypothetical protein